MKSLIENSKYLSLIAVVTLLVSFGLALAWGVSTAVEAWIEIAASMGQSAKISLYLIKLVDAFLVAIVLYLLAASIYQLFLGEVNLPSQLVAKNLPQLKSKLGSVIVLVLAVRFVEAVLGEATAPQDLMWLSVATALVSGTLIAFSYFGNRDEHE